MEINIFCYLHKGNRKQKVLKAKKLRKLGAGNNLYRLRIKEAKSLMEQIGRFLNISIVRLCGYTMFLYQYNCNLYQFVDYSTLGPYLVVSRVDMYKQLMFEYNN